MSQKKSVIFKKLLPVIKQYQAEGYTHEKIVELLKTSHALDLVTVKTFKSYLYRYASKDQIVNPVMSTSAPIPNTRRTIKKSAKLENVCYDIRGPILRAAVEMEEQGHKIIKLNIGNPAPFGFEAPQEIINDVAINLPNAIGYSDSKGIFPARKAVFQYYQQKGLFNVDVNDIYIGNGVSELIVMAMQGLLDNGDEMLVPMPDYPLWTAAVNLSGGQAIHYKCDEQNGWYPDIADIESKITANTRGIVVINPNNPTGAVYPRHILEQIVALARKHDLIIFADEIYDKIVYDGIEHIPMSTLASDVLCITFNGLSKSYRIAGFRSGWMMVSGDKSRAKDYIEGLDMLASMRLCANVQAQYAIQTALGGYQTINDLVKPGGRLYEQRNIAWEMLNEIPGVSCVKPEGALYCFPRLDPNMYPIEDDEAFMLNFLRAEKVLLVQGTGFNWPTPDHFRVVFLPAEGELREAIKRLDRYLASLR
ncbi:pyridoxal phosphate-dependent aminotransferase [Alkanindiges illinoisensis]|uniref:Glutamate-pyruvate aminotransferase AlaA n=1 Tax=Alkanindiges illinoisensis TaxID=197183 RepID=A0A4Y7XCH7_9GAMM|nr:pyridoxal phosphate-dependent aminotransferase [Alkanindiges illinoisensis]TEU27372.1 pyridoxal phosphate-dependent aminotransferase [Alkanindiges illinoisensis]